MWWIIKKTEKHEQGEEHKIMWSMMRKTEQMIKGKTKNNVMNDKKELETEQGEEHKIMW